MPSPSDSPQRPAPWVDRLLPDQPGRSEDERSRQRVIVGAGVGLAVLALPWFAALFALDPHPRAPRLLGLVGVLVLAANPLWLRAASTRAVARLTTVVVHALAIVIPLVTGGTAGPTFIVLAGVPALTATLHGPRAGWLDGALLLAVATAFAVAEASIGLPSLAPAEHRPFLQVMSLAISSSFTLLVVSAFLRAHARQREDLVAARDAAEAASRAKSRFLSTMSHELRTPMVGVLGAADLLAHQSLDPRGRHLLQILRRAAHAQLRLIGNILDLSRIEAEALDIESLPLALVDLVDDVVTIFRPAAISKRLDLTIDLDPALPPRILGDPLRLHQILANLLNNAIKFTERGAIRVRATAIAGAPPRVRIAVEDTGIGIPADRLSHIFEDFSQAEQSTSRRYGGSGLGLSISRRLAAAMGGSLTVTSVAGEGSTFAVEFPAQPTDAAVSGAHAATFVADLAPSPARRLQVLITDDDAVNRMILGAMVRDIGHQEVEAIDGADALIKLGLYSIDLVILDMHMPGLDGPATARSIRAQSGAPASVPILGLTADVTRARLDEFRESGVDDVLAKPVDIATLRQALTRIAAPAGDPALPAGP